MILKEIYPDDLLPGDIFFDSNESDREPFIGFILNLRKSKDAVHITMLEVEDAKPKVCVRKITNPTNWIIEGTLLRL